MSKSLLIIPDDIARKLRIYVQSTRLEVSGLGEIELTPGNHLRITSLYLLPQTCNGAETEIDAGAINDLMANLFVQGNDCSKLKLWWHSHAGMKTFWSEQDEKTCRLFSETWMVALVTNHAGDHLARIEVREPVAVSADLSVLPHDLDNFELVDELQREIKQKVKEKKLPPVKIEGNQGNHGHRGKVELVRKGYPSNWTERTEEEVMEHIEWLQEQGMV